MKLALGFITYNESSSKYLEEFLLSLKSSLGFLESHDFKVFAYDNSTPEYNVNRLTIEAYNRENNFFIEYISSPENFGFGRSFNILINRAKNEGAEYFLVLNPDIVLDLNAVSKLLERLEGNGELSSVSPKILRWDFENKKKTDYIDSCGIVLRPALRFVDLGQGEKDEGQYDKAEILGPSGACGLYRLSALEKIKEDGQYFDERFFMYKEDCDLAYRLFLAGFKSELVSGAIIYHDRTTSSSGRGLVKIISDRRQKSRQARAWSFQNQNLIFHKYFKKQDIVNKFLIVFHVFVSLFFSLILEQFLLKSYFSKNKSQKY